MARGFLLLVLLTWSATALWAGLGEVVARHAPASALAFAPGQPTALAAQILRSSSVDAGAVEGGTEVAVRNREALLRADPLSDVPMVAAGAEALAAGRTHEAETILALALLRNPRREATRVWLASTAFAQGETSAGLDQLARLLVLDRQRASVYLDAIAELAETPEGRSWLGSETFARSPAAPEIVRHLNGAHSDLGLLLVLNRDNPDAQASLIERALRERGASIAFILWLSLLPEEAGAAFSWPFNPGFEDVQAPPPFNWRYHGRTASQGAGRGVIVRYTGRGRQTLISQMMLLRPGSYRLTSELSGDGQERGGGFVWEMTCTGGGAPTGRTPRTGYRGAPNSVEAIFEVPSQGCEGQTLRLIGAPGEFPMRAQATVTSVAIQAVAP